MSRINPGVDIFISATTEFIIKSIEIQDVDYQKVLHENLIRLVCISLNASNIQSLSNELVDLMQQKSTDWLTQVEILPLLQILAFRNMYIIDRESSLFLNNTVSDLMVHKTIEV